MLENDTLYVDQKLAGAGWHAGIDPAERVAQPISE